MTENLPEHLREDIGASTPGAESEDEHLREDINVPSEEGGVGPEFSEDNFTSGQLNAGQRDPGVSPGGEYKEGREEELANRDEAD